MLVAVDASYYVFRAFYAMQGMSNSSGLPTNGLYAFTNMLLNVVRDHRPTHIAVAFDPPGGSFRSALYPEYKAHRDAPPEALVAQFPYFRQIVRALGLPALEVQGFEADDVIGTVTALAEVADLRCTVLTGDKDLFQLVSPTTTLLDSMRGRSVGLDDVRERFAVPPHLVADVLGLAGDASDNIPGVPGIGEKTAGRLIAEFGSLEALLARAHEIDAPKRRASILEHAEIARLSRVLATVRRDVPLGCAVADLELKVPVFDPFDALCATLEFRRFPTAARGAFAWLGRDTRSGAHAPSSATRTPPAATVSVVATRDDLAPLARALDDAECLSLEVVTDDAHPLDAGLVGVALATSPESAWYVPLAHEDLFAPRAKIDTLREVISLALTSPSLAKIFADEKRARHALARVGVAVRGPTDDASLLGYVADPNVRDMSVPGLARTWLGVDLPHAPLGARGAPTPTARLDVDQAALVFGARAAAAIAVVGSVRARVDPGTHDLYRTLEMPLIPILTAMEEFGVRIDLNLLAALQIEFTDRAAVLTAAIHECAGRPFAINAPAQLATVLFDDLGLPVQRHGKTAPSTDAETLESLADDHEICRLVLEYREVTKLTSTYLAALPRLVRRSSGRVHTTFNMTVAATGRLSSSDPNLQNIPIRSPLGRRIRAAFVPEPGWVLFGGDYSQIELRILAHMSEDPVLIDGFRRHEDIHRRTAAEVLGVPVDDVTQDQRAQAKAINFGLIYGMGASRLSRQTSTSRSEAAEYMQRYFQRISRVQPLLHRLVADARDTGYAITLAGRRRPIPELAAGESRRTIALGERLAMNTPIQGTAADIIKAAMIRVDAGLRQAGLRCRMLLTVHDELVFECPPEELGVAMDLVRTAMEGACVLRVPLTVELKSGPSWAALKS